jgi:hypothetical protein
MSVVHGGFYFQKRVVYAKYDHTLSQKWMTTYTCYNSSQQIDKISQQPENWENRNDPDLVQEFPKKLWVELDFTAPNLPLSLWFKASGSHYNSIYNNTGTKQVRNCKLPFFKDVSERHLNIFIIWHLWLSILFIFGQGFHYVLFLEYISKCYQQQSKVILRLRKIFHFSTVCNFWEKNNTWKNI